MRTVYNYRDIRKLEQSIIYDDMLKGIVITATASLAEAMRQYYPNLCVLDIHYLINELIPEWDDARKDIYNYLSLRNAIDDYVAEHENDGNLVLSLKRNAKDIWNAILLLTEADVYPNDILVDLESTSLIKHFRGIWEEYESKNSAIMNFRAQFAYRMTNSESINEGLSRAVNDSNGKRARANERMAGSSESLFFVGFYFITPIQARVFDALEKAGYKMLYMNGYDSEYPEMCRMWELTFEKEYEEKKYIDIQPEIKRKNIFGDISTGKQQKAEIDVKIYESNMEFARDIKIPLENGSEIYTPDRMKCESILKEYFPNLFERKHLLAYPVGQYIYYLHLMWNEVQHRPELNFDYVCKCFATGMLEDDFANGRDYLYELSQMEIMFKDCVSLGEWKARLNILKEAKKNVSIFEIKEDKNKRWHELMGNPFNAMSIYGIESEKIDTIINLITKLMDDAEYLFNGEDKTSLHNHFNKITALINERIHRDDVIEDEEAIAKEIIESLNEAGSSDAVCPIDAVRDALIMLVGKHFDDELLEPDINVDERIMPFTMIESSLLTNYGQDIYLVLADEFTLPGKTKKLPWPLSRKFVDNLDIKRRQDTLKYVGNMMSVIENKHYAYRYLFFSFIANRNEENTPNLHVSWVRNQGNKEVNASQYVLMLNEGVNKQAHEFESADYESALKSTNIEYGSITIKEPGYDTPIEVQYDYNVCRYRYLYSYLLKLYPSFKSEFHYSFLLSSLIRGLYTETGRSKEEVSGELFEIFPFLRNVEKRQALDFVGRKNSRDVEVFDNAQYAASRLDVHYLNPQFKEKVIRNFEGEDIDIPMDEKCRYCPNSDICIFKQEVVVE